MDVVPGKFSGYTHHRTAGRLDPGDDRRAEGQRYRDQSPPPGGTTTCAVQKL